MNKIITIAASMLINFMTVDNICAIIAKGISALLTYASKKGGKAWDITKDIIVKINGWTSLFLQVFDDDKMTAEEEKTVADAIKNKTEINKVVDLLKKINKENN